MTREEAIEVFDEMKKCYLGGIVDAIDMAIEALKAQIPMSPVTSEVQYGDHLQHCPSCGKALPNSGEYGISHYCYKCGQAVKWK